MATEVGKLYYAVDLDDKNLDKQLDGVEGKVKALGKAIAVAFAAAGAAAVGFAVTSVKAFQESQDVIAQTNAVLKSTGGIAGVTSKQVSDLASSLQNVTKFGDETIQTGENMLLTFTNIGKDIFPQATETMLDMSQALGQDVKGSAIQLGKALQDPILGVTALRRVGVNFTEEQQEMIEKLVKSGKTLEAQKFILKELQTEFGGSARAAGETFGGKLEILKNKLNDVQETIGGVIVEGLTPLVAGLSDFVDKVDWEAVIQGVTDAFKSMGEFIMKTYNAIAQYLGPKLSEMWRIINENLLPTLVRLWQEVGQPLAEILGVTLVAAIGLLMDTINFLMPIITGFVNWAVDNKVGLMAVAVTIGSIWAIMKAKEAIDTFIGNFNTAKNSVMGAIEVMKGGKGLSGLNNSLTGFTGWSIFAAVAIGALATVIDKFNEMNQTIQDTQNALNNNRRSNDAALKRARDQFKAGKISKERLNQIIGLGNEAMPSFASGVENFSGGLARVHKREAIVNMPAGSSVIPGRKADQLGSKTFNFGDVHLGDASAVREFSDWIDNNIQLEGMGISPSVAGG